MKTPIIDPDEFLILHYTDHRLNIESDMGCSYQDKRELSEFEKEAMPLNVLQFRERWPLAASHRHPRVTRRLFVFGISFAFEHLHEISRRIFSTQTGSGAPRRRAESSP